MSKDLQALTKLFHALPKALTCCVMPHTKAEQHEPGEDCPPLMRYLKAIKEAEEFLNSAVSITDAWQPIETAPKDATAILVAPGLWHGRSCSVAKYDDDKYAKKPRPFWSRDDDIGKVSYSRGKPPTHWMPLPPPPKVKP